MASNKKLLVRPGDGIGPEVVRETLRVVDWMAKKRSVSFDLQEGLVGGAAYDASGTPLTDETLADAVAADAVLFGSVGGAQARGADVVDGIDRKSTRLNSSH